MADIRQKLVELGISAFDEWAENELAGIDKEMCLTLSRPELTMRAARLPDCQTRRAWYPGVSLFVRDPKIVRFILKDEFENWTKPAETPVFQLFKFWIGLGVFTARHDDKMPGEKQLWYETRKTAAGIFTRGNFRDLMRNVFVEKAHSLVAHLEDTKPGNHVDMQQLFFAFTMDSIMTLFFSRRTDTTRGNVDEYAAAYDTAHRSMMQYFFRNITTITLMDLLPFPFGPLLVDSYDGLGEKVFRCIEPQGQIFRASKKFLEQTTHEIVAEKLRDPDLMCQRDLLALLIQAEIEKNPERVKDPKVIKMLVDACLNFIIAGRDTTACTLTWMFYLLAINPKIQTRIAEELAEKLGESEPTFDNMTASNVPVLHGMVYEALRLFPPVPEDPKVAVRDSTLPGGLRVRAGTRVLYCPYAMGRDPRRYPDPEKVSPDRWIPFKEPDPFEFPVFQAGPRICLGNKMAVFEAKVVAAMLLQRFSFTLLEGEQSKICKNMGLTMSLCNSLAQDSHNLWLIPKARI